MNSEDLWTLLYPSIGRYVETLLRRGKVGICAGNLRIIDVNTSCSSLAKQPNCDRFKLVIPYAGTSVTWEVLFDCNYPEDPPDFIFGPDDKKFQPNIDCIKSLADWNPKDERSLLNVIDELLGEYRRYHHQLMEEFSRLQFEYTSLIKQSDLSQEEVELHIYRTETKAGPVNFLIKLNADFSQIPAYLVQENTGEDSAILLITYPSPDSNRVAPQLYLSPRVEHALGGSANLRIPAFPSGGSLMDYVPNVTMLLKNKVDMLVTGFEKRKEYIAAFLSQFGRSVVEYDTEGYSKISLLLEWNDFFFVFHVELPLFFPKEQPVFHFQSIYHESKTGKPYTEMITTFPYSPRWSGNEMAERARTFILENIGNFQKASVLSVSH